MLPFYLSVGLGCDDQGVKRDWDLYSERRDENKWSWDGWHLRKRPPVGSWSDVNMLKLYRVGLDMLLQFRVLLWRWICRKIWIWAFLVEISFVRSLVLSFRKIRRFEVARNSYTISRDVFLWSLLISRTLFEE